jgi:hypothetical protein
MLMRPEGWQTPSSFGLSFPKKANCASPADPVPVRPDLGDRGELIPRAPGLGEILAQKLHPHAIIRGGHLRSTRAGLAVADRLALI